MALMIPFIAVAVILARETPQTCLESLTFCSFIKLPQPIPSLQPLQYTDKLPIAQVR